MINTQQLKSCNLAISLAVTLGLVKFLTLYYRDKEQAKICIGNKGTISFLPEIGENCKVQFKCLMVLV